MAAVTNLELLRSKFRGCLLGALFGDALGAEFEGKYMYVPIPSDRFELFSKEKLSELEGSKKRFRFTDDSAMTMALCRSLLSEKTLNINHLAQQYVETFFREPMRGYGGSVATVFEKLRKESLDDVTLPAREQFDGSGSYGNGAAMRVSPLALFYHNDLEGLKRGSKENALITHAHVKAIQGSILQAVAVYESLHTAPGALDVIKYVEKMIVTAQDLESDEEKKAEEKLVQASHIFGRNLCICVGSLFKCLRSENSFRSNYEASLEEDIDTNEVARTYVTQFQHIKEMLVESEGNPNTQYVIDTLGHGIKAVEAVPAAIFAFLYKSNASFKDALLYAMSLGGDTDTIASMAGAIAGAYWGDEQIPKEWFPVTESVDEITWYADELYELRVQAESE